MFTIISNVTTIVTNILIGFLVLASQFFFVLFVLLLVLLLLLLLSCFYYCSRNEKYRIYRSREVLRLIVLSYSEYETYQHKSLYFFLVSYKTKEKKVETCLRNLPFCSDLLDKPSLVMSVIFCIFVHVVFCILMVEWFWQWSKFYCDCRKRKNTIPTSKTKYLIQSLNIRLSFVITPALSF